MFALVVGPDAGIERCIFADLFISNEQFRTRANLYGDNVQLCRGRDKKAVNICLQKLHQDMQDICVEFSAHRSAIASGTKRIRVAVPIDCGVRFRLAFKWKMRYGKLLIRAKNQLQKGQK